MYKEIKRIKKSLKYLFLMQLAALFAFVAPALAASFEITPSSGNLLRGCTYQLTIYANATGQAANAADLLLSFNPGQIEILDSIGSQPGVQLATGNAFQAYVGNSVDNAAGTARLTAFSVNSDLTQRRIYAYAQIRPLVVGNIQLNVRFDGVGNTLDSNIADSTTSLDLLTSVTNANFNVTTGSCQPDTAAPSVTFITPEPNAQNFSGNTIVVQVTDNISGVNLSSVQIIINSTTYSVGNSQLAVTNIANGYRFTITLSENWNTQTQGTIVVSARDNNQNAVLTQNVFNTQSETQPPEIPEPPVIPPTPVLPTEPPVCNCDQQSVVNIDPRYIFKDTFLENSPIDNLIKASVDNLGPTSTTAILSGALSLITLLPYLPLLFAPGLLLNLLGLWLFGAARRRKWGIVVDATTKAAIPLAICRLYTKNTTNLVSQTLTDIKGRYGFSIKEGEYRLEVVKDGYNKQILNLAVNANSAVNAKVELVPLSQTYVQSKLKNFTINLSAFLRNFLSASAKILMFFGIILALFGFLAIPNLVNFLILLFYTAVVLIFIRQKIVSNSSDSLVINAKNNLRVGNIKLQLYSVANSEKAGEIEVSPNGNFDYFGDEGEFFVALNAYGYKFSAEKQQVLKLGKLPVVKVNLHTGGNRIRLFVEEFTDVVVKGNNSTKFANPFGG